MENNLNNSTSYSSLFNIASPLIILVWIEIIAACIIYGFGFIGNLLSLIIVVSQKELQNISTGVFFLFMTISNTIHLWTLTTEFLITFNVYVYPNVFLQCRLNYFIQDVSRAVSTYLAIGVTFDLLLRSELPLRSRIICTRRNAIKFTLICLIIFAILFSFWFCPMNTLNPITGICYTGQSTAYNYFFNNIFLPFRFIFVCIIPIIIKILANIRMLFNIRQSRRRVEQWNQTNTTVTPVNIRLMLRRMTPLDRMMFYMMLTSVGTFIITQIPFHIYTLVQSRYSPFNISTTLLIRAILLIWSGIYFGIGFYLYCLASPRFRKKFFLMSQRLMICIREPRPE